MKANLDNQSKALYIERMPFRNDSRLNSIWTICCAVLFTVYLAYALFFEVHTFLSIPSASILFVTTSVLLAGVFNKMSIGSWAKFDIRLLIVSSTLLICSMIFT